VDNGAADRRPVDEHRPLIIAHRGASGYLPEHTLEAKALAYGQGADYLEQDVVATRDHQLLVLHDIYLERVTDVAALFPDRRRADGHYYVVDFELEAIRQLTVTERRRPDGRAALYPQRFPAETGRFRVVTLAEEIEFIQGLNRSTGRQVGLYPEIKEPQWHAEHGIDLGRLMLEQLASFGYAEEDDPVFVQCFDARELRRIREGLGSRLKLVQLVGRSRLERRGTLRATREYAQVLAPPYSRLVSARSRNAEPRPSVLAVSARQAGLLLHPYTFRREKLPPYAASLEDLLEVFLRDLRMDGVFCDFPDVAARVRDSCGPLPVASEAEGRRSPPTA
jgi:glycerophosphoryl diester phosphodiesterase